MEIAAPIAQANPDPYVQQGGRLSFQYHEGQRKVMASQARYILVLAGLQSGKTIIGPWWMLREMTRRGPGDYLVAAPTFRLLDMKCLPEYKRLFVERLQLGTLRENPVPLLTLSARGEEILFGSAQTQPTRIIFGHAQDADSLESATVKAAHCDEAGQKKFKRSSNEAIMGRLSIHRGRALYTTTPYTLGWLKSEIHDRALEQRKLPPEQREYELVQFESTMNPAFSEEEFEEMRAKLPGWKFRMRYKGQFDRPAGMIYDCFDRDIHLVDPFEIDRKWTRYLGMDFGGVNTAGVWIAEEPKTDKFYLYHTYKAGSRTASEHKEAMLSKERGLPEKAVGGSWSEDQWRSEFAAAGLPISKPPISDVEVGIERVYALLKTNRLFIFSDQRELIDEIESYSRILDDNDEPTEKIEDKETYHRLDALRYIAAYLNQDRPDWSKARKVTRH